jgi:hypothetical protein
MSNSQLRPFSIRIFLPDGTSDGLRIIERSNWTGLGIVVPRSQLVKAKERSEFSRTGVYVLVGQETESELPTIYIGQGDPICDRLDRHVASKDFWTWAIFFVTRDSSLNKAHIGYLEANLIRLARSANRCTLDNHTLPQSASLSEADVADMDSFLADMLSIFPLVGLHVFERPTATDTHRLLTFSNKKVQSKGYESAQGFVVVAGSTAVANESTYIHPYLSTLRKALLEKGILKSEGGELVVFSQDYEFTSPSTAGGVVLGRPVSGPECWRDESGRTLREIRELEER